MIFAVLAFAFALVAVASLTGVVLLRNRAADPRIDGIISQLGAIAVQFQQSAGAQNQLSQSVNALNQGLGQSLSDTAQTLGSIGTRLSAIDEAQKNITALSGQVVSLQEILANKQSRGAYGQAQMEEIVRDGLPPGLYEFQATLSNNSRPDCKIRLPGAGQSIVIDSKFPLEGFAALRKAASEGERKSAQARVRSDVQHHVDDIAGKYLIPGETQPPAIMFVPSEAIYAELHDGFPDIIQKAHRAQVIVVSPNILMLAINTVQTVMRGARMREQASLVQREVGLLVQDVKRLSERIEGLKKHFAQTDGDLREISTSIEKITKRGRSISEVQLGDGSEGPKLAIVSDNG